VGWHIRQTFCCRIEPFQMTNRIAIILGVLIILGLIVDAVLFESETLVFLGKRFAALIEWMAFWR
jgi:hypothetical protein